MEGGGPAPSRRVHLKSGALAASGVGIVRWPTGHYRPDMGLARRTDALPVEMAILGVIVLLWQLARIPLEGLARGRGRIDA